LVDLATDVCCDEAEDDSVKKRSICLCAIRRLRFAASDSRRRRSPMNARQLRASERQIPALLSGFKRQKVQQASDAETRLAERVSA
jgi:hypothetical protein